MIGVCFAFFSPLFFSGFGFLYHISLTQNNMFSILVATDRALTHFFQVLGSRGAPGSVFNPSTGYNGTAVSAVFKGCLVDTSRNDMLLCTGTIVAAFPSLVH